jgi:hypothetical protein
MPTFRVDHDADGHAEVSPAKPRKVKPLEDEAQRASTGWIGWDVIR